MSGGNDYINIKSLSQQDWHLKNCDVSCGDNFINIHALLRCDELDYFNYMDGDAENDDVWGGRGYMNRHKLSQHNVLS